MAAKVLAYAECARMLARVTTEEWCDCMITATKSDGIPPTQKQTDIQLKTDWKFVPEDFAKLTPAPIAISQEFQSILIPSPCNPFQGAVFRPPLV